MWGALLSGGVQLLKQIAPAAINWGMQKLTNSNFGKKVITPNALDRISSGVQQLKGMAI
jgi:hypothetical protein